MPQTRSMEPLEAALAAARSGSVLVVYATRAGSTRGIAERIAERIAEEGRYVELLAAEEVETFAAYDAVVLGSAVYAGAWLPAAETLARRHRGALAGRRVWLFSVDALPDTHPLLGGRLRRGPRGIADLRETIQPREYRVFAGVNRREQIPWRRRLLLRALGGRIGDARDWVAIDAWATCIARALRPA